jgi:glycerate-2-kinase
MRGLCCRRGSGRPIPRPACIIAGGETTVTLKGKGKGGRNQELAMAAAPLIAGLDGVVRPWPSHTAQRTGRRRTARAPHCQERPWPPEY